MNEKIDIVIPWLNPTDNWYKLYGKYSKVEKPGRVRDLGTFKYFLRSIETNCPWINCIFLILFDKEQKPAWLIENEKLKIIYHKDFLPAECIPNFNSLVVDMYISRINELSENFIFMNDDMFFMNYIPKENYFVNGKPVHQKTLRGGVYKKYNNAQFRNIEENNYNFVNTIAGQSILWSTFHLPIPFSKSLQQFIWYKYNDILTFRMYKTPIRADKNVCNWIFYGIEEVMNHCVFKDIYRTMPGLAFDLKDGMSATEIRRLIKNQHIVCFNDGDFLTHDFERVKVIVNKILNEKFPNKSSFEK